MQQVHRINHALYFVHTEEDPSTRPPAPSAHGSTENLDWAEVLQNYVVDKSTIEQRLQSTGAHVARASQ